MNTPKWLFFVLVFWLLATLWSNALEPSKAELLPSDISSTSETMSDPSLTSAPGLVKIPSWVSNLWKALIFDYAWFTGYLFILRIICIFFTVAGLYCIADIIWKIRSILLGQ